MAKARTADRQRSPVMPPAGDKSGSYFRDVWDELRKVIWPDRAELTRMTGIVVATVFIFAGLIGGFDFVLAKAIAPLYSPATSTPNAGTSNPQPVTVSAQPSVQPTK